MILFYIINILIKEESLDYFEKNWFILSLIKKWEKKKKIIMNEVKELISKTKTIYSYTTAGNPPSSYILKVTLENPNDKDIKSGTKNTYELNSTNWLNL